MSTYLPTVAKCAIMKLKLPGNPNLRGSESKPFFHYLYFPSIRAVFSRKEVRNITCITKQVDNYNRVAIPKETLTAIGLKPGDLVAIRASRTTAGVSCLVLEPYSPGCALCGGKLQANRFVTLNDKRVCAICHAKLQE